MVRRWSHINSANIEKNDFFFLKKLKKIKIFKKNVMLKRFNKKYTKTRRKAFTRLRHDHNLFLYHNILKHWIRDYFFSKYCAKLQFSNNFFINNFIFFNANFTINKNPNIFFNWNFFFLNFSKKSTLTVKKLYKQSFFRSNMQKQHTILSKGWTLPILANDHNELAFPSYVEYDGILYQIFTPNSIFNISSIFEEFVYKQIFERLLEIYKILIHVFYAF